jgi:hypothetical protein
MSDAITLFIEEARAVTVVDAALALGIEVTNKNYAGPCPSCGGTDRFSINPSIPAFNCRQCGGKGRDGISLMALAGHHDVSTRVGFLSACSDAIGRPIPEEGERESDEERRARLERIAERKRINAENAARADKSQNDFRQREIDRARGIYLKAPETPLTIELEKYLFFRTGFRMHEAVFDNLRLAPSCTYWHGRDDRGFEMPHYTGPAMIAPYVNLDGRITGCHQTWIDLRNKPKYRANLGIGDNGSPLPTKKSNIAPEAVIRMMEEAAGQREGQNPETPASTSEEAPAAIAADHDADPADHSDTDNGIRLKLHFGEDLDRHRAGKGQDAAVCRMDRHALGCCQWRPEIALAIAQRLGGRIAMEAAYIRPNPFEQMWIDRRPRRHSKKEEDRSRRKRTPVIAAEQGQGSAWQTVKKAPLDHAVTSKNIAKMRASALVPGAAHHEGPGRIQRRQDDGRGRNATLKFHRKTVRRAIRAIVSPEKTPDAPEYIDVCIDSRLEVIEGHRRQDLITHIVPVKYDAKATMPEMADHSSTGKLPDEQVRAGPGVVRPRPARHHRAISVLPLWRRRQRQIGLHGNALPAARRMCR